MRAFLAALAMLVPAMAHAVDNNVPPEPTPTTTVCTGGQVWDHDEGRCVDLEEGHLDDDALYDAAREFAHAGLNWHALAALRAMSDQRSDRVLTYMGFVLRKTGAPEEAMAHYRAALAANPDNLPARSYFGQGLVALGDLEGAEAQLVEIRARGGSGSWPEIALQASIRSGVAIY